MVCGTILTWMMSNIAAEKDVTILGSSSKGTDVFMGCSVCEYWFLSY